MVKRIVLSLFLLAIVAVASSVAYSSWLGSKYGRAYERVALGATEADVRNLSGSPSQATAGTFPVEPTSTALGYQIFPGCAKALWYSVPLIIQMYSYCFDDTGLLVHKYHWLSW